LYAPLPRPQPLPPGARRRGARPPHQRAGAPQDELLVEVLAEAQLMAANEGAEDTRLVVTEALLLDFLDYNRFANGVDDGAPRGAPHCLAPEPWTMILRARAVQP
jgi:hypothetical protein